MNVCPIGRTPSLSKDSRAAFEAADREAGLRKRVVAQLVESFGPETPYRLNFSIGGEGNARIPQPSLPLDRYAVHTA